MKVEKTSTGLIIHEPSNEIKSKCLQYFSLQNPIREYFIYSGNDPDHKPLFGKEKDVLYVTSGFLKIRDRVIEDMARHVEEIKPRVGKSIHLEMDREPRSDLQRDCIKMMIESKSPKITIELKPGVGKEEPYSRKIPTPTPDGYTLMGDLKLGDKVFSRDGRLTTVKGIFEQGVKDVYKITFQDGRVAHCGKEHLWTVKSHKNGIWKTVQLQDMIDDFRRISPWKLAHNRKDPYNYKYYIPTCQPVNYPKKKVPIDPWIIGCFIGNGCCTCKYLTISSGTDEVPNKIGSRLGFTVKKNPANYSYGFFDYNGKPIRTKDFFKNIPSMIGVYSRDKVIPNDYLINDVNTRLAVLQGLMDTDGSISYNDGRYHVRYTSTSKDLLEQVVWILKSFGFGGNIIEDKRGDDKYVNGYCGSVIFRIPNTVKHNFFTILSKKLIAESAVDQKQENHYGDLLIKNIEFSHREKCRCIMVDNPEHLYLTEDFIVTHNTFISLYAISKLGLKPLIVAPTTLLKNQWVENFTDMGIPKNDIATNIYDAPNKTYCVVTISSIENALRDDWNALLKAIDKSEFGIKVTDESHLHMKGLLKLDAICNIKHNWYLSATLGRSDASEDRILNRALSDAERFVGNSTYKEYKEQFVEIYLQDIHYYPSAKMCGKYFKYGKKGLIRSTYYNMLMAYWDGKPFIQNIINVIKHMKRLMNSDKKVIVLVPIITIIDALLEAMSHDQYFTKYTCAKVNGTMPLPERRKALESDIIVSTSMSMGTGVDVSDLVCVINFDQYASPIITEQICGRLRSRGWKCFYVDVCDHVKYAKTIETWGTKRRMLLPYFPGVYPDMKMLPKIKC